MPILFPSGQLMETLNFFYGPKGERRDGKDGVARENLTKVRTLLRARGFHPPHGYTDAIQLLASIIAAEVQNAKL